MNDFLDMTIGEAYSKRIFDVRTSNVLLSLGEDSAWGDIPTLRKGRNMKDVTLRELQSELTLRERDFLKLPNLGKVSVAKLKRLVGIEPNRARMCEEVPYLGFFVYIPVGETNEPRSYYPLVMCEKLVDPLNSKRFVWVPCNAKA